DKAPLPLLRRGRCRAGRDAARDGARRARAFHRLDRAASAWNGSRRRSDGFPGPAGLAGQLSGAPRPARACPRTRQGERMGGNPRVPERSTGFSGTHGSSPSCHGFARPAPRDAGIARSAAQEAADSELTALLAELYALGDEEEITLETASQLLLRLRERKLDRELAAADGERLVELQQALAKLRDEIRAFA